MHRIGWGLTLCCLLEIGCTENFLFKRRELVAARQIPEVSVRGLQESSHALRLIPYDNLKISQDDAATLAASTVPLVRVPVRTPGFYHQVAGAVVFGSLVPLAALSGLSLYDARNASGVGLVGPGVCLFLGGLGVITGSALFIRGAVLNYPKIPEPLPPPP